MARGEDLSQHPVPDVEHPDCPEGLARSKLL